MHEHWFQLMKLFWTNVAWEVDRSWSFKTWHEWSQGKKQLGTTVIRSNTKSQTSTEASCRNVQEIAMNVSLLTILGTGCTLGGLFSIQFSILHWNWALMNRYLCSSIGLMVHLMHSPLRCSPGRLCLVPAPPQGSCLREQIGDPDRDLQGSVPQPLGLGATKKKMVKKN